MEEATDFAWQYELRGRVRAVAKFRCGRSNAGNVVQLSTPAHTTLT